jgi:hypothetical protein
VQGGATVLPLIWGSGAVWSPLALQRVGGHLEASTADVEVPHMHTVLEEGARRGKRCGRSEWLVAVEGDAPV